MLAVECSRVKRSRTSRWKNCRSRFVSCLVSRGQSCCGVTLAAVTLRCALTSSSPHAPAAHARTGIRVPQSMRAVDLFWNEYGPLWGRGLEPMKGSLRYRSATMMTALMIAPRRWYDPVTTPNSNGRFMFGVMALVNETLAE